MSQDTEDLAARLAALEATGEKKRGVLSVPIEEVRPNRQQPRKTFDDATLLVANDNNFPMSSGRRPPRTPDDNEFIRIRLHTPLPADPGVARN